MTIAVGTQILKTIKASDDDRLIVHAIDKLADQAINECCRLNGSTSILSNALDSLKAETFRAMWTDDFAGLRQHFVS